MSTVTKECLPRPGDDSKMLWDKYRWYIANWIADDNADKNRDGSPMSYEKWLNENGVDPKPEPIPLEQVRYGETFAINGWQFTVLDHIAGGVLCIDTHKARGPFWSHDAFDKDYSNSLAVADIGNSLEEYAEHLKEERPDLEDALLPMFVNLKDTAGVRNYGLYECEVGLLTLEEYGKYKRLIPRIDDPWWLATPYKAVEEHGPVGTWGASVWYVDSVGNIRHCLCSEELVTRPTVTLKPDILVTPVKVVAEEQSDAELEENKKLWESYLKYLDLWRTEHAGVEHYGEDPWCFDEWKDIVKAGDQYTEQDDNDGELPEDYELWHDCYLTYVENWIKDHAANGVCGESPATYEKWLEVLATDPAEGGKQ